MRQLRSLWAVVLVSCTACTPAAPTASQGAATDATVESGLGTAVPDEESRPGLPPEVLDQFPGGALVLDVKDMSQAGNGRMAVLLNLPNPAGAPANGFPMQAELAIVYQTPSGWRVATAVRKGFAQAPMIEVADVAGMAAVSLSYHTGANSQGMLVVRGETVVYDGVADSVILQDVDRDGTPEVVKMWSPFCQSHVASPRLSTVYAWRHGEYEVATGDFGVVLARDRASFQAAVERAELSTTVPLWTAGQKACLHDALGYIAQEAGNVAEAQAQFDQVRALDPTYEVDAIAQAAAGIRTRTSP